MRGRFFDPGRLRRETVLEEPVRVADALGGQAESWEAVATLWAHLEPASAVAYRADTEEAEITHRVVLRFDTRVWPGRRLRLAEDDRTFAIRAVRDLDETGRYLLCLTREES